MQNNTENDNSVSIASSTYQNIPFNIPFNKAGFDSSKLNARHRNTFNPLTSVDYGKIIYKYMFSSSELPTNKIPKRMMNVLKKADELNNYKIISGSILPIFCSFTPNIIHAGSFKNKLLKTNKYKLSKRHVIDIHIGTDLHHEQNPHLLIGRIDFNSQLRNENAENIELNNHELNFLNRIMEQDDTYVLDNIETPSIRRNAFSTLSSNLKNVARMEGGTRRNRRNSIQRRRSYTRKNKKE
jgi:hypothetical protein